MSVRIADGVVHLSGRCGPEDVEGLLVALQDDASRSVDLDGVERVHLAVVQVLLAARPRLRGVPANDFFARHVLNLLP